MGLYQSHFVLPPPGFLWGKISKPRTMRGVVKPPQDIRCKVANHEGGHAFHRGGSIYILLAGGGGILKNQNFLRGALPHTPLGLLLLHCCCRRHSTARPPEIWGALPQTPPGYRPWTHHRKEGEKPSIKHEGGASCSCLPSLKPRTMRGVLDGGVGLQHKTTNHDRDVKIRGGGSTK